METYGIEIGDIVRLNSSTPTTPPWTIVRIGTVGEDENRATVATIMRDSLGSKCEREVVNILAVTPCEEGEQ